MLTRAVNDLLCTEREEFARLYGVSTLKSCRGGKCIAGMAPVLILRLRGREREWRGRERDRGREREWRGREGGREGGREKGEGGGRERGRERERRGRGIEERERGREGGRERGRERERRGREGGEREGERKER